ncbi:MAG TPA: hypothetical protein VK548_29665 [Candidatus Acidoferrum sp.]|nr:hypothetical protein [Candidatus Acidoferrum sp.]
MTSRAWRWALVGALALLGAAGYWGFAFVRLYRTGSGDWQRFQHQWEAARVAVMRWGEFPLWDPFHCGGVTLFGDPEAQVYGPLFWLLLPLGTTIGLKIFFVLHTAAGLTGMFVLARRELGAGVAPAIVAAAVWGFGGFFAWHGSSGHITFLPFYLAPWLLLAWRRAAENPRWCVAVAAIMALVLLEGGVYPFPYFTLLLGFDAVARLLGREPPRGIVRAGAIAGVLTLLLGSFRLLPILETLELYPRLTSSRDSVSFREVIVMLTGRGPEYEYEYPFGHEYVWPEYGSYTGWVPLIAAALGGVVAVWGGRWRLVFGAILFGGLMLGYESPWHPWAILHLVPPFDSLRVPSRFAVLFTFYLGLLAALALRSLTELLARYRMPRALDWGRRALPLVLAFGIAADVFITNRPARDRWHAPPPPSRIVADVHYHLLPREQYDRLISFPALGVSNRGCHTGMTYRAARGLWDGDVPQVRLEGTTGTLHVESRTANTMRAEVTLKSEGDIVFNQTWAPGWTSSLGTLEKDAVGRIVVRAPAGRHDVVARYVPGRLVAGAALSLTGLVLSVLVLLYGQRARPATPSR